MDLDELLNKVRPSDQAIELAARLYMDTHLDGLPPHQMKATLERASPSADELSAALDRLEDQAALRRDACLAILSEAWQDSAERERIRAALEGAQAKMPVVETAILAMVAMYGMYLLVTKGEKTRRRVVKRSDGTFVMEEVELHGPTGPLAAVAGLFKKSPNRPAGSS